MRKILSIIFFISLSIATFSQNGFYVNPEYKMFSPQGATQEIQSFAGIKGGMYLNEYFTIGAAFYGSLNQLSYMQDLYFDINDVNNISYLTSYEKVKKSLDTKYGGIVLEGLAESLNNIHISVPIFIGYGTSSVYRVAYETTGLTLPFTPSEEESEIVDREYRSFFLEKDAFFVFEPGIVLNIQVTDGVYFTLGGSYKMIKDNTFKNVAKKHLDIQKGMNFNAGVKLKL